MWAHRAPGTPRALGFKGGTIWQSSGETRRENVEVCLNVIASWLFEN
jgi:hypothetical protein